MIDGFSKSFSRFMFQDLGSPYQASFPCDIATHRWPLFDYAGSMPKNTNHDISRKTLLVMEFFSLYTPQYRQMSCFLLPNF